MGSIITHHTEIWTFLGNDSFTDYAILRDVWCVAINATADASSHALVPDATTGFEGWKCGGCGKRRRPCGVIVFAWSQCPGLPVSLGPVGVPGVSGEGSLGSGGDGSGVVAWVALLLYSFPQR